MAPGRQSTAKGAGSRANGLLSIPASATQKNKVGNMDSIPTRIAAPRLKLVIRRLPPSLSLLEFETALGEDWKVNGGKVDWLVYKLGKVSKDAAKPSRPARAYLHLMKAEYINQLDQKVRTTTFIDAKNSAKDSSLLGPPAVEFAPFGRVPNNRPRKDARQGTIDQDQEFIDFLESLTNPIPKTTTAEQDNETLAKSKEKVTTTPLIQFLRDKKANKGKEPPASSKGSKHNRQDSKDSKTSSGSEKKTPTKPVAASSPDKRSAQAIKVENAARDAVKVLSKQAANTKKPEAPQVVLPPAPAAPTPPAPLAEKKRERGNASVAARMLQRDLGLGSPVGRGGRGGRRGGAVAPVKGNAASPNPPVAPAASLDSTKADASLPTGRAQVVVQDATRAPTALPPGNTSQETTKSQSPKSVTPITPPTGPAASRNGTKPHPQARSNNQAPIKLPSASKGPPVSPTATQAFLKHANPSQGVTEPLLEEAFSAFGAIKKVEIDKKKGFAYIDFEESDGLQKAIRASPVKVAQGQVVVLERKTGPTLQVRNMRGGPAGAGTRGGNMPVGPRVGRGGSMGRGGRPGRPPLTANNANNSKASQTNVADNSVSVAPSQETKTSQPSGSAAPPAAATT